MNINTRTYWERRFKSDDWSQRGGNFQTRSHATNFAPHLGIPLDFSGTICDVGCAEGDAMPVYRLMWPKSRIVGVDFAESAIERARAKHGAIADFRTEEFGDVPESDVIIASHVFEHLDDDIEVLSTLRTKCKRLFVIVPYREYPLSAEHLRSYDEGTYNAQNPTKTVVCSAGWQYRGLLLWYHIHLKNLVRPLVGKRIARPPRQIVFEFEPSQNLRAATNITKSATHDNRNPTP